jgi:RNA polymerase sigma-70 factor (TIGR02960 family)
VSAGAVPAEAALVAAARAGDEAAFGRLTDPYARELHLHCYRMLGSLHDAEDALQETLLRAWRHLAGFESRSSFRAWLYRIATNVCLSAAARRPPEPPPAVHELTTAEGDAITLAPYPDALLDELESGAAEPDARYDLDESVRLAFLAAVQLLPPRQRAVLLLRDVLGFAAGEVAELIDSSTAGVNSALQRARATLAKRQAEGRLEPGRVQPPDHVQRSLVRRYVEAWESVDVDGLVALLREDVVMTMPPEPLLFRGRRAIGEFFATVPAGGALDKIRLLPTRANREPAVAAYLLDDETRVYLPYGLMVLSLDGDAIAEITGFADPTLFPLFGLPATLEEGDARPPADPG